MTTVQRAVEAELSPLFQELGLRPKVCHAPFKSDSLSYELTANDGKLCTFVVTVWIQTRGDVRCMASRIACRTIVVTYEVGSPDFFGRVELVLRSQAWRP